MKEGQGYIQDIAEIRSMMERSSRFLSLSGWAGIMAGIYALAGAFIAYAVFDFQPDRIAYRDISRIGIWQGLLNVIFLAMAVLILSIGTAVFLSSRKAEKRGEKIWNATSRRLLANTAAPLVAGGVLILILLLKDMVGLAAPLTLVFYGLALYAAGNFTYYDVKYLGLIQVVLGLLAVSFIEWSLLLWAIGFGLAHIVYGIYIYYKYER